MGSRLACNMAEGVVRAQHRVVSLLPEVTDHSITAITSRLRVVVRSDLPSLCHLLRAYTIVDRCLRRRRNAHDTVPQLCPRIGRRRRDPRYLLSATVMRHQQSCRARFRLEGDAAQAQAKLSRACASACATHFEAKSLLACGAFHGNCD